MKFKKVLLPFIAGALAISLAACGDKEKANKDNSNSKLAEQQVDEEKVVVIVNDEELKGDHYNAVLSSIQSQMQQAGQDPTSKDSAEQVKMRVIDTIVNQTLLLQQAKNADIQASDAEIDEEYTAFAAQFGDEETLKEVLKSQNMDVETLKEQIAESIIFKKYQDQVAPIEEVTEQEIQDYYDKIAAQAKDSEQELPPLQEVSEEIKGFIQQEQQQKKLTSHVKELKEDAKIEVKI